MKIPQAAPIAILLLVGYTFNLAAQTSARSQIEAALDSGAGRAANREAILKVTPNPVPALIRIARSERSPWLRRSRAIFLLATFKTRQSERALGQIARIGDPTFRCPALQSLAEMDSSHAIPVLISKLDDHAVCMKMTITDPARERDVYVSDEAVRLLEQITGQSFDQESTGAHRSTKPWKDWWAKQQAKARLLGH